MTNDRGDDELLSQIDELKARMDRLMRGGTSTSNSAVLTDQVRANQAETRRPAPPPSPPVRTTVRDLAPPEDREVLETYPESGSPVAFPDDHTAKPEPDRTAPATPDAAQAAPSHHEPDDAPPPRSHVGSVVEVEEQPVPVRPKVVTFDDLGNVIKEELARDDTVPPEEPKRGPGLASRFGGEEEYPPHDPAGPPVPDDLDDGDTPAATIADEDVDSADGSANELDELDDESPARLVAPHRGRSRVGTIAAIWIGTAVASGAIATLHFTGLI